MDRASDQILKLRTSRCAAFVLLALLATAVGMGGLAEAQPAETGGPPNGEKLAAAADPTLTLTAFRAGEQYLVVHQGAAPLETVEALLEEMGGWVDHEWPEMATVAVAGIDERAAHRLRRLPGVSGVYRDVELQWVAPPVALEFVALDEPGALSAVEPVVSARDPSTAFFYNFWQWNMRQIQADAAWQSSRRGAETLVCVLDTGIDATHGDLIGRVRPFPVSRSVVASDPLPEVFEDFNFHGTFVAALITSNGLGIASVAPEADLCAIKVLSNNGMGSFSDVIAGIVHATDVGADVINMSLGALLPVKGFEDLVRSLQDAVDYARLRGVVVVAAAGNNRLNMDEHKDLLHIPSMLRGVLSAGATGPLNQRNFDRRASYSNYGKRGLDVMAPGGEVPVFQRRDAIISACARFAFCSFFPFFCPCISGGVYVHSQVGTSFASPHTAGAVAVAKSEGHQKPGHCVTTGADRITESGNDPIYGRGRINVFQAALCQRLHTDPE